MFSVYLWLLNKIILQNTFTMFLPFQFIIQIQQKYQYPPKTKKILYLKRKIETSLSQKK